MSGRVILRLARLSGIGMLSLCHYVILYGVIVANIGGSLAQGTRGEDIGHVYRESQQGQQNRLIEQVLSWPIIKFYDAMSERYRNALPQSAWRGLGHLAIVVNSLAWGIGAWLLLELLMRGVIRLFYRR